MIVKLLYTIILREDTEKIYIKMRYIICESLFIRVCAMANNILTELDQ